MIVYNLNEDKKNYKTITKNEIEYYKLIESQKKVIKITESQFKRLIEGIEYL